MSSTLQQLAWQLKENTSVLHVVIILLLYTWQVVDSPFAKLTELMLELVEEQKIPIPRSLMRVALSMMRRSVKKRAGFNIDEVAPIDQIHTSFIPCLFGECSNCSGLLSILWHTFLLQNR